MFKDDGTPWKDGDKMWLGGQRYVWKLVSKKNGLTELVLVPDFN